MSQFVRNVYDGARERKRGNKSLDLSDRMFMEAAANTFPEIYTDKELLNNRRWMQKNKTKWDGLASHLKAQNVYTGVFRKKLESRIRRHRERLFSNSNE